MEIKNSSPKPFADPEIKETMLLEILELYCTEDMDIVSIIKSNIKYPSVMSFYNWINKNQEYKVAYEEAQKMKAHYLFARLMEVSEGNKDVKDSLTAVSRDRLICETIKFAIAKILPKTFGERIDITSDGQPLNIINLGGGMAPPTQYIDVTPTPTPLNAKTKSGL